MERLESTASAPPLVRAWTPPTVFDEYQIVRPLGQGAMGQVFLAKDTLLDRLVAVKFIAVRVLAQDELRERFRTEARAIARLHHPNVVMVYRVGEVDGQPYLVSEYVRGEGLDKLPLPVPWPRILAIAVDLARGLAAAHREGVLHRDIKPANVIVAADGTTKLLDFGLAALVEKPTDDNRDSHALDAAGSVAEQRATAYRHATSSTAPLPPASGEIIGTPLYMAPEIWRQEPATRLSDVYSLGVLLYELAVGRSPYADKSLPELCAAVTTNSLPSLASIVSGIDAGFAGVVDRCVARDPTKRFESSDALREALERLASPNRQERPGVAVPYRGLQPFTAEQRTMFFGRESEVRAVVDRLRTETLLLVTGDSGAGKSSLVAAGVLPELVEDSMGLGKRFTATCIVPGRRPANALATALSPLCGLHETEIAALLATSPSELVRRMRRCGTPVVLVVDQLEELITLSDPNEAGQIAELLCELAAAGSRDLRVLATVRVDFLARVAGLSRLRQELPRALYFLAPLSAAGLRDAVVSPARALGWSFESDATVDALVNGATGPGGLPLLAFALAELWDARDLERHVIPATALDAIGGVAGALARHADAVISSLVPADRAIARHVLSMLVTPDGTRERRSDLELTDASTGTERTRHVIEVLVRGRVLVARQENREDRPTYELAHEALVVVWETLRGWLTDQAGAQAARARVERAAAEWKRLGQPRDGLWHRRQLAEVNVVDDASLGPSARVFLTRSRRAVRLRRALSILAVIALPLASAATYVASQWIAQRKRDAEVAQRVAAAKPLLLVAADHQATLEDARRLALEDFDAATSSTEAPERKKEEKATTLKEAERAWDKVIALTDQLETEYDQAAEWLELALRLDGTRTDVRRQLAQVIYDAATSADSNHRFIRRDALVRRLRVHDVDGEFGKRWIEPAHLSVTASPTPISITVQRYELETDGRSKLSQAPTNGGGTLHNLALAPGSYLITLNLDRGATVRYPMLLEHGEQRDVAFAVPATIPAGFVFVAAGRFLTGSPDDNEVRRNYLETPPMHVASTGPYFIARNEVTMQQWIEFLNALPQDERERRRPRGLGPYGKVELTPLNEGHWQFLLQPARSSPSDGYHVTEEQHIHYLERHDHVDEDWLSFPVSGISWDDANAYAAWLATSGRVSGARLCTVREWERAARGADGRKYPHGDRLRPSDANFDMTYGQRTLAFGPDPVGTHPESDSPFGVSDLAGNVWEWTRANASSKVVWQSGGSFYQDASTARSDNRRPNNADVRSPQIGLRLCADVPPR